MQEIGGDSQIINTDIESVYEKESGQGKVNVIKKSERSSKNSLGPIYQVQVRQSPAPARV